MNTLIFCIAAMIYGNYAQKLKFSKYVSDKRLKDLLEKDVLTGLYNRYRYNLELDRIRQEKSAVTVCSFDVNGLKTVNDTLGHAAGDELITAAGECIRETFGPYGEVFRTRGDEFMALLPGEQQKTGEMFLEMKKKGALKKGRYFNGLYISCGAAAVPAGGDFENALSQALKAADDNMYEDKEAYYRENRIDRRRLPLCGNSLT